MSYREKALWVSLATMLLVWGSYFTGFVRDWQAGQIDQGRITGEFAAAVALIVVIQVGVAIVLSILAGREADEPADDRERGFALSAYRPAYILLVVLVVCIMLTAPVALRVLEEGRQTLPPGVAPVLLGNALLAALVLSETVHAGWQLIRFRRGG